MRTKIEYIFYFTILTLFLSGISIISNHLGFALKLITISFTFFVIGSVLYLLSLKNEK